MSFVANLGAAIGVGNLTPSVACENEGYQGERTRGVATITGGNVAQVVEGLRMRLVRMWETRDRERNTRHEHTDVLHTQPVAFRCEVLPGIAYTVPFELDIPWNATLAERGEWHVIEVVTDVAGGVDPSGRKHIVLWPARPVAYTLQAVVAATGWRLNGFASREARAGFTRAELVPGAAHAERFDRIYLELSPGQGFMQVHVKLDLKEGAWKALTGADEYDYSFSAPDIPTVVGNLQALIQKYASPR